MPFSSVLLFEVLRRDMEKLQNLGKQVRNQVMCRLRCVFKLILDMSLDVPSRIYFADKHDLDHFVRAIFHMFCVFLSFNEDLHIISIKAVHPGTNCGEHIPFQQGSLPSRLEKQSH